MQFADGSRVDRDNTDLFIDATGCRSPLGQALNGDLNRPLSPVREIVSSSTLPDLAAQLDSRFVKTVMAEREQIRKTSTLSTEDDVVSESAASESGEKLISEIDDLLDEIDEVLETNAEDFVKSYIQKGGE